MGGGCIENYLNDDLVLQRTRTCKDRRLNYRDFFHDRLINDFVR